jgi:Zn-dependent protease with chaperone function
MTALVQSWWFHLLHAGWQATAAAGLVLALARVIGARHPRLRHAVLVVGLLKFALPPMLPLPTGLFSAAPPVPALVTVRDLFAWSARHEVLLLALLGLHAVGAVVMLARLGIAARRLALVRRRARPAGERVRALAAQVGGGTAPPVLLSGEIGVPLAAGVLRPAILLPQGLPERLSDEALADVLRHELHHVRRGDAAANVLQGLLLAAWWFHPLAHVLDRRARVAREESCDDAVVAGGRDPGGYAQSLLDVALLCPRGTWLAPAALERPEALVSRVRRLAAGRGGRLERWAPLAAILLGLALLPGLRVSDDNVFAFDRATRRALGHHSR